MYAFVLIFHKIVSLQLKYIIWIFGVIRFSILKITRSEEDTKISLRD